MEWRKELTFERNTKTLSARVVLMKVLCAHGGRATIDELSHVSGLDAGYVRREVHLFADKGLVHLRLESTRRGTRLIVHLPHKALGVLDDDSLRRCWTVFWRLWCEADMAHPILHPQLAQCLGCTPRAAAALVRHLKGMGYVEALQHGHKNVIVAPTLSAMTSMFWTTQSAPPADPSGGRLPPAEAATPAQPLLEGVAAGDNGCQAAS